tara:strand:+ start:12 stop:845 length:834 start_codon:yes stop_codon:yes gene_type:complete
MAVIYLEVTVRLSPLIPWREVMIAEMGSIGFEGFEETSSGFKAYIPKNEYREKSFKQIAVFSQDGLSIDWNTSDIAPENWNSAWEQNFTPTRIGDRCVIRADFHPPERAEFELIITPKMSFGTGHHETTQLMVLLLLEIDCHQKSIVDMGTGTGVLAILSEKKGATNILAIDNDPWCIENTLENIATNQCKNIRTKLTDQLSETLLFDSVLANINRNILLEQMDAYAKALKPEGNLLLSGFYVEDLGIIRSKCESLGFRFIRNFEKNQWVAALFIKL